MDLSAASSEALHWWIQHLLTSPGATTSRAYCKNGLVMKWGDGSGTGTGCTTEFYELSPGEHKQNPNAELWMGVWLSRARPESSNWKEAMTVLHSLRQERAMGRLQGTTVFYITDNLVSYYIINNGSSRSPKLHEIVTEILELVEELGCRLEIVHAPGKLMIHQGTDGLSRGLWVAPERRTKDINQILFEAVPFTKELGRWASSFIGQSHRPFEHLDLVSCLSPNAASQRGSIWTPPPECARQVISAYLHMWVQSPFDTQAIFLVPRILQKQWGRISRYVQELGVFQSDLLPGRAAFVSHLPFVFLHLAPHVSHPRKHRLVLPSVGNRKDWHHHQAEEVSGLS